MLKVQDGVDHRGSCGLLFGLSGIEFCDGCGKPPGGLGEGFVWINGHAGRLVGETWQGAEDTVHGLIHLIEDEKPHPNNRMVGLSLYFCRQCLLEMIRHTYVDGNEPEVLTEAKQRNTKKRPSGTAWHALRFRILERDQFTCQYCGQHAPNVVLHVDHRLAIADGGSDDPSNLVAACSSCNQGKEGLRQWRQNG